MQTQIQIEKNLLQVARTIRKELKKLLGVSAKPRNAICGLFERALDDWHGEFIYDSMTCLKDIMQLWPDGTGCRVFPIPASRADRSKRAAAEAYVDLPHWEGEQLELRLELLDYIIEQLEGTSNASK